LRSNFRASQPTAGNTGIDARIVTQESRDTPAKMSLNTAAGILGIQRLNGLRKGLVE
jgi:hypothetical protein